MDEKMKGDTDEKRNGCKVQCMVLAVVLVLGLQVIMILMLSGAINTGRTTVHHNNGEPQVLISRPTSKPRGATVHTHNLTAGQISSPIPLMNTDQGVRYNSSSIGGQVRLDVLLETNCPDSVNAWPELKLAADYYGPAVLDLVVYNFQLPYHRWGNLCTQGWHTIKDQQGPQAALTFMEYLFSVYTTYSSGNTEDRTHNEMLDQLANDAFIATGIDQNSFKAVFGDYSGINVENWKHSCRRGAAGTPWYYLNGVDLGINYVLSLADLQGLIDPLLP